MPTYDDESSESFDPICVYCGRDGAIDGYGRCIRCRARDEAPRTKADTSTTKESKHEGIDVHDHQ